MSRQQPISLLRGMSGSPDSLHISWHPELESEFFIHRKGVKLPPGFVFDDQTLSYQGIDYTLIFESKLWWQRPKICSGPWIYVSEYNPAQGIDGPLAIGWGQRIYASLPTGEGRISSRLPQLEKECVFDAQDVWDPRLFACQQLRSILNIKAGARHQIRLSSFATKDVAFLVCLRVAYPNEYFELLALPQQEQVPQWKRLCQNLGIRCGKAPRWTDKEPVIVPIIDSLFLDQPHNILKIFNEKAVVVPETLWLRDNAR